MSIKVLLCSQKSDIIQKNAEVDFLGGAHPTPPRSDSCTPLDIWHPCNFFAIHLKLEIPIKKSIYHCIMNSLKPVVFLHPSRVFAPSVEFYPVSALGIYNRLPSYS